jgi:hypothetical protein
MKRCSFNVWFLANVTTADYAIGYFLNSSKFD